MVFPGNCAVDSAKFVVGFQLELVLPEPFQVVQPKLGMVSGLCHPPSFTILSIEPECSVEYPKKLRMISAGVSGKPLQGKGKRVLVAIGTNFGHTLGYGILCV